MSDDSEEMRASILRRIDAGFLPRPPGERTYGGYGDGRLCDACGRTIGPSEVQYEVDCAGSTSTNKRTIVMHRSCHGVWLTLQSGEFESLAAAIDLSIGQYDGADAPAEL
jgi:hypothetical protein